MTFLNQTGLQVMKKCAKLKLSTNTLKTSRHKFEPLFQFIGDELVFYAFVAKHLQNMTRFISLNPALYKGIRSE